MIPKQIHYCWFGHNSKPQLAEKCIASWRKYCPDYTITEWNEDNYDLTKAPLYVQQAYQLKKWAFVTDYVRLQIIYENGGIYFDTDVELIKPIDNLLAYKAYFGFEDETHINTGLGFGAEAGSSILKSMMDDYQNILFVKEDGTWDTTPCPQRNTAAFLQYGLQLDNSKQILDTEILILPKDYLCPFDYYMGKLHLTKNSLSIHRFSASWQTKEQQEVIRVNVKRRQKEERCRQIKAFPKIVFRKIVGDDFVDFLKKKIGKA